MKAAFHCAKRLVLAVATLQMLTAGGAAAEAGDEEVAAIALPILNGAAVASPDVPVLLYPPQTGSMWGKRSSSVQLRSLH